jgi:protein-tyrosine-phosphatase
MKVLFVCYANVARSQVAQAYFTKLSRHPSDSAGIAVNELVVQRNLPSRKLKDEVLSQRSVGYIGRECGVDVSERERQQLVPAMLDEADRVIVIAEKERWPGYLQEGGKVVFWDIPDPRGHPDEFAYDVYKQVQRRVERLVEEIG